MNILVIGDFITDTYRWCDCERMCPEAPVPVLVVRKQESRMGGAGNVLNNLLSLTDNGITAKMLSLSTSEKVRYFVGNRLMFREDNDGLITKPYSGGIVEVKELLEGGTKWDAIIISDYNKGGISYDLARQILVKADKTPVFVDAKCPDPDTKYGGAFCIFPNEHEHPHLSYGNFEHIVRKLGSKGCSVDGVLISTKEQPVFDVTGAGDTFIAAFVIEYLNLYGSASETSCLQLAARSANVAAGESVRHVGTYAVRKADLSN